MTDSVIIGNVTLKQWNCLECGSAETKRRARGLCHKCYQKAAKVRRYIENPEWRAIESRLSYQRNKETRLASMREKRRQLKWTVIEMLGGKCACCGEATPEFLTVDHINGDGAEHRKSLTGKSRASSTKIYKDIMNQGFPKDKYRVLCFNCNCSIGCWGYCPHTHTRQTKYPIKLGSPPPLAQQLSSPGNPPPLAQQLPLLGES